MKRFLSILLSLVLLCSVSLAEVTLNGDEVRNIKINPAGLNEMEDGVSPTTGRWLDEVAELAPAEGFTGMAISGVYTPVLVQISNPEGGIGYSSKTGKATGYRAPWGAQYADIIYESILTRPGETRLSFLFSDLIPDEAGPVRSARAFHALLREEWDCAFAFYGQQLQTVPKIFKDYGADKKGVLFAGTDGENKPHKAAYVKYPKMDLKDPNDMSVNAAMLSTLVPLDHEYPNHTYLFTDDLPDWEEEAETIYVNWGYADTATSNSIIEWDEDEECYYRYMTDKKGQPHIYQTLQTKYDDAVEITFQNVIVQLIKMDWWNKSVPYPESIGTGNADYFIGGRHMAGVWQRNSVSERTVFYDENGDELELQRGRTLIIVMDYQTDHHSVRYE